MSCLGVHFSLSHGEIVFFRGLDEASRRFNLVNILEPAYFTHYRDRLAPTEQTWDLMHRALTDGTLDPNGGIYPLNHVVLGGEDLHVADDYIMRLKTPDQVHDVAVALPGVSEDMFHQLCKAIDLDAFGYIPGDDEIAWTYECFEAVRTFWAAAAAEERFVLFTASQ